LNLGHRVVLVKEFVLGPVHPPPLRPPPSVLHNICDGINESNASVWHSRLCHLNFDSLSRLSSLRLILNLFIVKGSMCQSCVQSKQPRKPHKVA
jgi:hypothetical protein